MGNTASSRARLPPALAVPPNTPKVLDNWGTEVWLREANFRGHFRVCVCVPSPTLSPTDPVPRGLLTLCPGLHIYIYIYIYIMRV